MILQNAYIFLEHNEKSQISKSTDGRLVIKQNRSVFSLITEIFSIQKSDITDKELFIRKAKKKITIEDISCNVIFKCSEVVGTIYLDIYVEGKSTPQTIKVMDHIHNSICGKGNLFSKLFICLVSYDAISEHYCNKLYPKLNAFERKLRRLMFNLYTVNFGKDFLNKTTGDKFHKDIQQKVLYKKSDNLKEKDKEELLKSAFYSFDYNDIQNLLFDKRWTDFDEEQKNIFLSKINNLSDLSDGSLREAFNGMKPKSDWERFFVDKISETDIEKDIDLLRQKRNKVAHCKNFGEIEYKQCLKIVNKLVKAVDRAIIMTEEKDFVLKNQEYLSRTMSSISESLKQFSQNFEDTVSPIIKQFQARMSEVTKPIENIRLYLNSLYMSKNLKIRYLDKKQEDIED